MIWHIGNNDNDIDDICKEQYSMKGQKQSWIA